MFDEVCVPHNGSPETHRAVEIGAAIAEVTGVDLRVLAYTNPDDHTIFSEHFYDELFDVGRRHGLTPHVTPLESKRFLSDAIVGEMRSRPGSILCMASRGRGRSAVLLGSLTADVLTYGPGTAILCGPNCEPHAMDRTGPILVALDGGADAEGALNVVGDWAGAFERRLELVEVLSATPSHELAAATAAGDVAESGYLANVVRHHPELDADGLDFEVLHGKPVDAIVNEAVRTDAAMIAMVTRVPLGVDRLLHGSVTDGVVHESPVPVIAMRASAPLVTGDGDEDDDDIPFQLQILWM